MVQEKLSVTLPYIYVVFQIDEGAELPNGATKDNVLLVVPPNAETEYVEPAVKLSWSDQRLIADSSALLAPTIDKLYVPFPKLDFEAMAVVLKVFALPS